MALVLNATGTSSPYVKGVELRIRRHLPPEPFGGEYGPNPRPKVPVRIDGLPVKRVAFALDNPPLETGPLIGDEHSFTITGTKTLRRPGVDPGGADVVTGYFDRDESAVYLAKIYDGVYYPLENRNMGWDCMTLADHDYAIEGWAYESMQPVATVGAKLVPEYFGAWTFPVSTDQPGHPRWVRMLLLQFVQGETVFDKILKATKNDTVQYSLLPDENLRLQVLKNTFEAEIRIWWDAEVRHQDLEPRNVIVQADGNVVIIDFNDALVYRFCGYSEHPKNSDPLFRSPIEHYWPFIPGRDTFAYSEEQGGPWGNWIPEGWVENKESAAEWLLKTWGNPPPDTYKPLSDRFLNHLAHRERSKAVLEGLEKLGRKPAESK
ncbi:hypothetical protein C8A00DRAFT_46926 [Chaetomidium leptoderma]|uniref:Protein kinase domain-containing protein n=1 Tax=Chaetomidium leptoderma TaxID=669021 RepID=A0AAN6ZTG5_9PEZI|nr:hypothetical protein C8A00DRAFT_46926 [Chaetomidium leptoderma]